jgi:histone-binding protein RBBP4
MAWSPHTAGSLLSGSEDTTVKLWDVSAAYSGSGGGATAQAAAAAAAAGTQIMATSTFLAHTATVEDVAWHARDVHLAGSVGDDKRLCLWDVRDPVSAVQNIENAHESDINCLAFNPVDENLLATGCEGTVCHFFGC